MRASFFGRDRRGIAAVEFAILCPLMIATVFGSIEVEQLGRASLRLGNAAQSIADLVAQQTNVSATAMANFCTGATLTMTPMSRTPFSIAVVSVTNTASGRHVDWQDDSCGSAVALSNAASLAVSLTPNIGDSVIIAQAAYSYSFVSHTVLARTIQLARTVYARPRGGGTVTHS
jgi:Flp pilus assembly protein TadG